MDLKKKKILITAGPTWVPIDSVRVISNIASGETGILLAKKLMRMGARPTLVLGPGQANCLDGKLNLKRFRYFDELKNIITRELKSKNYDILIHTAAVSDYRPKARLAKKADSGKKLWKLNLVPTPKLIKLVKKTAPGIFLVGFKYKPKAKKEDLFKRAKLLAKHTRAGLVVANTAQRGRYQAYILSREKIYARASGKKELADKLIKTLAKIKS
jgi:phosphopantothenoylcysteine decarboxylase/phosphopantothenate--cysteine ligase